MSLLQVRSAILNAGYRVSGSHANKVHTRTHPHPHIPAHLHTPAHTRTHPHTPAHTRGRGRGGLHKLPVDVPPYLPTCGSWWGHLGSKLTNDLLLLLVTSAVSLFSGGLCALGRTRSRRTRRPSSCGTSSGRGASSTRSAARTRTRQALRCSAEKSRLRPTLSGTRCGLGSLPLPLARHGLLCVSISPSSKRPAIWRVRAEGWD